MQVKREKVPARIHRTGTNRHHNQGGGGLGAEGRNGRQSFGRLRNFVRCRPLDRGRPLRPLRPIVGEPRYGSFKAPGTYIRTAANLAYSLAVAEHSRRQRGLRDAGGTAVRFNERQER